MGRMEKPASKKSSNTGRNLLVGIGLFFVIIGVFLGAFACSFQVMISADSQGNENEKSQTESLQEEVQLLTDQITVLENELERYKEIERKPAVNTTQSSKSTSSSSGSSSQSSSKQNSQDN